MATPKLFSGLHTGGRPTPASQQLSMGTPVDGKSMLKSRPVGIGSCTPEAVRYLQLCSRTLLVSSQIEQVGLFKRAYIFMEHMSSLHVMFLEA